MALVITTTLLTITLELFYVFSCLQYLIVSNSSTVMLATGFFLFKFQWREMEAYRPQRLMLRKNSLFKDGLLLLLLLTYDPLTTNVYVLLFKMFSSLSYSFIFDSVLIVSHKDSIVYDFMKILAVLWTALHLCHYLKYSMSWEFFIILIFDISCSR